MNPTTNRVYVCNQKDDTVSVLDGSANTFLATVPVGQEPHWSRGESHHQPDLCV